MTDRAAIAAAVAPVVEGWLLTSPGLPLVLSVDAAGAVECRVGLADRSRLSGARAAEVLGVSRASFYRNHFYGLQRGTDGKFSRVQVDNLKQRRAG